MGTDKSFVLLQGKPVFEHVLERVKTLGLPLVVIANDHDKYVRYNLSVVKDLLPGQGSLGGLYTAISASTSGYTLCVACDMPSLNPALLRHLIDLRNGYDAVVPLVGDGFEAMHAVYSKTCLLSIRAQLAAGELKASGFYTNLRIRSVSEAEMKVFDPDLRSFVNLNTPDDVAQANTNPA